MIDAYASTGMPVVYSHWRYGKYHSYQSNSYKKGKSGLAYEMVINSDPCISYLMENNNLVTQALVIAHACVDADTEYLSPTGWKKISEYDNGLVGQFTEKYEMEFVKPINYIINNNCEYMNEFENSIVHQRLTDDHRVAYVSHENNNIKIRPFHEIKKMHETKTRGFHGKFINVFKPNINTSIPYSDNELRFLVAAFADGSIVGDKVRFHLKKERKINRLIEILDSLNINYFISNSYGGRNVITCDYKLENKYYTNEFYKSSTEQLKIITDEVLYWDGTISPQRRFFSTCKQSVDFIQYAFASIGFRSNITEILDIRTDSKRKKLYNLNITKQWKSGISGGRSSPPKIKQYKTTDNKSYCFTVPSGMLVFRSKDYIFVTGNCYGHNAFFKGNFLFKEWTHADSIVEYCLFARDYINECENKYGFEEVEAILDAAHSLEHHGVDKYKRPPALSPRKEKELQSKRIEDEQKFVYEFWNALPLKEESNDEEAKESEVVFPKEPQENLLYFIEKHSPVLKPWQREIIRIVRKLAQYFYPQGQTKVSNEGFATFIHYEIIYKMFDDGYLSDGFMQNFLELHTNVVFQPDKSYLNPYYLGFNIYQDIKRICLDPTEEDKEWFPYLIGKDWKKEIIFAMENFKDESFITQYLSPHLIRKMRLFNVLDDSQLQEYHITHISNDDGYKEIRKMLSQEYNRAYMIPDVQITKANIKSDRKLTLTYYPVNNIPLDNDDLEAVEEHLDFLWGFDTKIIEAKK